MTDRFYERLRTLLPDTYAVFDTEVQPRSMGSAGLRFGTDGKVEWNKIWGSFCDLAMAGGPPHRGTLLMPAWSEADASEGSAYQQASEEICRGLSLVTGLFAEPSPVGGWIRLYCTSAAMSGWLARAVVMENVSAHSRGLTLELPAGAHFRVEKEIKNVITSVAKTCHYWQDHMSDEKHQAIADLLAQMERESPLMYPSAKVNDADPHKASLKAAFHPVQEQAGLELVLQGSPGWLGLECRDVALAIWMMRALAVSNVLSRREGTVVYFPDGHASAETDRIVAAVLEADRLHSSAAPSA